MRFLDVFNEIQKGDYALTDEAVYHCAVNMDVDSIREEA